jgi:flavin-dependent dehydrogenase
VNNNYDALIAGGGPAGAVSALLLARAGLKVCVLEKSRHPRFHIGESILPRCLPLLQELGLETAMRQLPHVPKFGAEFGFGNDFNTMRFGFTDGLLPGAATFNIERAPFDQMLLDAARDAGAEIFQDTAIRSIDRLDEDCVQVSTADRQWSARILLDCSGHGTLVGRHLGTRRNFDDPHLQKVAYFEHYENVERLPGADSGHPTLIMSAEGWFWLIGLNETKTSVGFVTRPQLAKQLDVAPDRLLQWAIRRCPVVRHRMRNAVGPSTNQVLADFSYTCRPLAGPGYLLVGDAGCFLDPIFSTGVTLAMMSGREAAQTAIRILRHTASPRRARRAYRQFVQGSTAIFWRLIRDYYRQGFRELFMEGQGPLQVHKAVISALAGQVFPRPVWALRWRLHVFHLLVRVQQYLPIVPRRAEFSLLDEVESDATPAMTTPMVEA